MEAAKKPLDRRTWLVIVLLALVGQIAWAVENNFFNLFIQDAFGASLSDVALMVSASAATATATTLLVGTWSDRVGKRKLFVVAGTLMRAPSSGASRSARSPCCSRSPRRSRAMQPPLPPWASRSPSASTAS